MVVTGALIGNRVLDYLTEKRQGRSLFATPARFRLFASFRRGRRACDAGGYSARPSAPAR
jgi:hypothetical protein